MASVHGIVLAGTYHWSESWFGDLLPRPLLPVAEIPLICYPLQGLRDGGIRSATICANSSTSRVRDLLADGRTLAMRLDYYDDGIPRGPAGCVRDAAISYDAQTFVVVDGTAIPILNLERALEHHRESGAAVTIVVQAGADRSTGESEMSPVGIYVLDRRVVDFIPRTGFQDIKESLIPRLYQAGERIVTHVGEGACPRVLNARSYLSVNQWLVERLLQRTAPEGAGGSRHASGGYIAHPTAYINPQAEIVGPVLLGRSARVMTGAMVVGPAVIGSETIVEEGALVSRSVTWNRCVVSKEAVVDRCVLADDAVVDSGAKIFNLVKVKRPQRRLPVFDLLVTEGRRPEAKPSRPPLPGLAIP